jgi:excisionase family DNA binding protein
MWLTIEELAEHLKVSKETIYKMAKAKKIPSSKIGNQWRFNKDVIDQWLVSEANSRTTLSVQTTGRDYEEIK